MEFKKFNENLELTESENQHITWEGIVDNRWGTLKPVFTINGNSTAGTLKYFHGLKNKKVKITIEVEDSI